MKTRLVYAAIAALALQGCATMSKEECLVSDWRTIGYEDGAAGLSPVRVGQHRKACADHGVSPDLDAYQAGRDEGLREYCQAPNGFNVGSNGAGYGGACPKDLETDFLPAYKAGRKLYTLERKVNRAQSQIVARQRELDRLDGELKARETIIISDEATVQKRLSALLDAKEMSERQGQLEEEIDQLELDKAAYQRELDDYRTTVAYNF